MKTFIFAACVLAAPVAQAQLSAIAQYDFNRQGSRSWTETALGIAFDTEVGRVDASFIKNSGLPNQSTDAHGFELGYSTQLDTALGAVTGRVGFGRRNLIDGNLGSFTAVHRYYTLSLEHSAALSSNINTFINFRHRNGLNSAPVDNRLSAGFDFSVASITARLGYGVTRSSSTSHGIHTSISYNF